MCLNTCVSSWQMNVVNAECRLILSARMSKSTKIDSNILFFGKHFRQVLAMHNDGIVRRIRGITQVRL